MLQAVLLNPEVPWVDLCEAGLLEPLPRCVESGPCAETWLCLKMMKQ